MAAMTTLRSRKETRNRQAMLDAAKALFIERGYTKTTMGDIADQADFGVATLYNYFKTKEGIFAAMARDDMTILAKEGEQTLQRLPDDPVEAVCSLLRIYCKVYDFISYTVVQDFMIHSKGGGPLRDTSEWIMGWKRDQVKRALDHYRGQGTLSPALDTEVASFIIIDLLMRHYYRANDSEKKNRDLRSLKKSVALILGGWCAR